MGGWRLGCHPFGGGLVTPEHAQGDARPPLNAFGGGRGPPLAATPSVFFLIYRYIYLFYLFIFFYCN
jgi:hypothetical protein